MIRKTRKSITWAVILMLAMLLSCLPVSAVFAAAHTTVTIDGRALQLDVPPTIIEGRTLVPLRAIFEALGAEVEWDSSIRTVTGRKGATTIILPIGSRSPTVNGVPVQLDVPGTIVDGRTLVPARFIAESLGAQVDWVAETRTVVIASDGIPLPSTEVPTSPPVVEEKPPMATDLQSRIENDPIFAYMGKSMDEIRAAFGSPSMESDWRGAHFISYDQENLVFFFDYPGLDKVIGVGFLNYQESAHHNFLGLEPGTTFSEIKERVGNPMHEGVDESDEIGGYLYTYDTVKYIITIGSVDDTPGVADYIEIRTKYEWR